jgi:zinc D-Ala-D-Ala carboxypeptidase
MRPGYTKNGMTRKRVLSIGFAVIVVAIAGYWLANRTSSTPAPAASVQHKAAQKTTVPVPKPTTPIFDKAQYSLTDPTSIWVVVNKQRPLAPKNYIPADLVVPGVPERVSGIRVSQKMAPQLEAMFAAANRAGVPLKVSSGYRSYTYQVSLYNGYVKAEGQSQADAESARPGFSEHQTGLAADLAPLDGSCSVEQCFASTAAGKWLAANAYQYGFIIRYPSGLTSVTGYEYEPWHVRYVGVDLATEMHTEGVQTLEQFFGLPAAPNY